MAYRAYEPTYHVPLALQYPLGFEVGCLGRWDLASDDSKVSL